MHTPMQLHLGRKGKDPTSVLLATLPCMSHDQLLDDILTPRIDDLFQKAATNGLVYQPTAAPAAPHAAFRHFYPLCLKVAKQPLETLWLETDTTVFDAPIIVRLHTEANMPPPEALHRLTAADFWQSLFYKDVALNPATAAKWRQASDRERLDHADAFLFDLMEPERLKKEIPLYIQYPAHPFSTYIGRRYILIDGSVLLSCSTGLCVEAIPFSQDDEAYFEETYVDIPLSAHDKLCH